MNRKRSDPLARSLSTREEDHKIARSRRGLVVQGGQHTAKKFTTPFINSRKIVFLFPGIEQEYPEELLLLSHGPSTRYQHPKIGVCSLYRRETYEFLFYAY